MSNNITIAKHAGFCFGVERATEAVEKKIKERRSGEKIYTLGHLIHNQGYISYLEENGVNSIEIPDIEKICDMACADAPVTVYIRAHGITVEAENLLRKCKEKNQYFDYVDMTCPYVKKIHRIAKDNTSDDTLFAVLGSATHPEVVGIISYAEGEKMVFEGHLLVGGILPFRWSRG